MKNNLCIANIITIVVDVLGTKKKVEVQRVTVCYSV